MNNESRKIQKTYLTLTLLQTFAASFIFAVNTLFLLDAGLSNTQAFAANSFFFLGQVIFEIPTGVVADAWGRRASYLLGAITLFVTTAVYLLLWQVQGPFWAWAASSMLLGLGFTFFSGAVEAWLVDALNFNKFKGGMEEVFAKGQIASGVAMMVGSFGGGVIAQTTSLAVPYIMRCVFLLASFLVAWRLMHDVGFKPDPSKSLRSDMSHIVKSAINVGWKTPSVRWLMLASPFATGAGAFVFYASQPYLLELYGDPSAYSVIGAISALIAVTQIIGGLAQPSISRHIKLRSSIILGGAALSASAIFLLGFVGNFWIATGFFLAWAMIFSAVGPFRQAFINACLPSEQRATILSVDALMGSVGGAASNPVLGRFADVYSYSAAVMAAAVIQILAMPFLILAKLSKSPGDPTGTN